MYNSTGLLTRLHRLTHDEGYAELSATHRLDPRYRVVGRYLLGEPVGAGGMATVYFARQLDERRFPRVLAIKQLHARVACDRVFARALLDEARLLGAIKHPNVVTPYEVILSEGEVFVVMQYVHGETLDYLCRDRPVAPAIASAIVSEVLLGLHAAHEAADPEGRPLGIVHRDVSPQNILVDAHGAARIVDFGIAKASWTAPTSQNAALKGKLGYLAPEQLRHGVLDRRTDVFGAGVVLWQMLTGRSLFAGALPNLALGARNAAELPLPSTLVEIPAELDAVVARALALDPEHRYGTALEMTEDLLRALPRATVLTVSSWVNELADTRLEQRRQQISEIEGLAAQEFTLPLRSRDGLVTPLSSTVRTRWKLGTALPRVVNWLGALLVAALVAALLVTVLGRHQTEFRDSLAAPVQPTGVSRKLTDISAPIRALESDSNLDSPAPRSASGETPPRPRLPSSAASRSRPESPQVPVAPLPSSSAPRLIVNCTQPWILRDGTRQLKPGCVVKP